MTLEAGTKVGPYEILNLLGQGGMAEVYRARDMRLSRDVAIKVLTPEFGQDADRMARFEREARAVGMLNHPNILAVYDIGSHEGLPYLVTELLEGQTLRSLISAGPLPPSKTIDYAQQVARGLAAAHERGTAHRDLKPDNLFVTRDGIVKILDFGLAKLSRMDESGRTPQENATEYGVALGTTGYMSPEQIMRLPVDHRTDIFSLGCTMYEMLAGQRAFRGENHSETIAAILRVDPKPLHVAPALERIVQLCLEKNPEDRFQSARDLGFALQAIASSDNRTLTFASIRDAFPQKLTIRNIAVAVAAVATIAAIFLAGRFWRVPPAAPPVYHQATFRQGMIFSGRFAENGDTILYTARWNGDPPQVFAARREYPESRAVSDPSTVLLSVSRSGEMAILRNARYLHHLAWTGTLARMPIDGGAPRDIMENVTEADWDPSTDGRMAIVRQDNSTGKTVLEYPLGRVIYETPGWISHIRISPKGDSVAFLDHPVPNDSLGSVAVVNASGQKKTLSDGWASESGLSWTPRGNEVWFSAARTGTSLDIFAVTLNGKLRTVLSGPGRSLLVDIAPDGRLLMSQDNVRHILAASIEGAPPLDLAWLDHSFDPSISADGKLLLSTEEAEAAGPHYAVCLRKTDGSPVVRLGEGAAMALSPDGKWALAQIRTVPGQLILLSTGAGQPRVLERGNIVSYGSGGWLPDGQQILFTAKEEGQPQRAYLQSIAGGPPKQALLPGFTPLANTISPDGRSVICRDSNRNYQVCPIDGGEPRLLQGLVLGETPMAWTSDGHTLFVCDYSARPMNIVKLDPLTGRRQLWKEITAERNAFGGSTTVAITPDGRSFVHFYVRILSDLYVVENVK